MISLSLSLAIGWKLQDLILSLMRMISTRCYLSFSLNPVLWISVTGVFSSSHQVCWLIFINLLTKATVWVFCSFVLLVISGLDTMDKALKLSWRTVRGSKFAVTTVLPIKLVRCGLSRAGTLPFLLLFSSLRNKSVKNLSFIASLCLFVSARLPLGKKA